ncbi:uncharacterized protein LOC34622332 [Cyclospora cayetanensis]|uniref:Uncharacterized protein LOC34622332 n=1 Tax=Cyclospora cayetanensis TaxID=88456 RepID=A0A6P6S178_9EIME|nr:uncharacterized protein LOC34622332 [Cyclospora cayetanensis]
MRVPPVSLCFCLVLPAHAATSAIQLLNQEAPLASPVPQAAFWPPAHQQARGQMQQQQVLQLAIGIYEPEWRRRLSFQHLKRCKALKQTQQALVLLGYSPVRSLAKGLFPQLNELETIGANEDGENILASATVAARAAADKAAARGESIVTAVHTSAATTGNFDTDPAAAAAAAADQAAATETAAARESLCKLQASGVRNALWASPLWGELLLVLLAVPAVAPQSQYQQQPWSAVWPCFFNRKRPSAMPAALPSLGESLLERADPSASERNTAVAPLELTQKQKEAHAALLQLAADRSCCLIVFHSCGAELTNRLGRSDDSSSSTSSSGSISKGICKKIRTKDTSACSDSICRDPLSGSTATTDAGGLAKAPVEVAPCGCPIIGCGYGPHCFDFLCSSTNSCTTSPSSRSSACGKEPDHPLQHPVLLAIDSVAKKLLTEQEREHQLQGQQQQQQCAVISEGNYYCQATCVYMRTEPCIMCSMGLLQSRVEGVFFMKPQNSLGGISVAALHRDRRLNHPFRAFQLLQQS